MSAEATLEDIITDARGYATTSLDAATDLVQQAQTAAQGMVLLDPRPLNFSATPVDAVDEASDPGAFEDGFTPPGGKPEPGELVALHIPEVPDFPIAPEALDTSGLFQFDRPVFDIGAFDDQPPAVDTDVVFPDAPTLVDYEAPETSELKLRDTPEVSAPTFEPNVQIREVGDPDDIVGAYKARLEESVPQFRDWVETSADAWLTQYAPEYHTAMAQLEAKLAAGYAGNTALPDAVEAQIFDRGVSRAEDERVGMDAEASERFSRRGYNLPPIALSTALARNREVVARNVAGVARDTAIKRAELEHQHVQFVMQLSSSIRDALRGQVVSYANLLLNINAQALQDAQQIASIMTEVYRLLVERTRLDLDHLRILTVVYETQMKSALADLEIFKVEMDAAKTRKDAELADVDVWAKKIGAQNTRVNLYLAELRGIAEQVGIEKLRVDIFGEQVRAYTAQVGAKEAEFGAYRSAIAGDAARVKAYAEQVSAYGAGVSAARTKVEAESALTDVGVQYNKNLIDIFQAELRSWESELDAEGKRFGASSDAYRTRLERYKTDLDIQLNVLRTQYDADRLDLEAKTRKLDADVGTLLAQGQLFQERTRLVAHTAMSGAEAHASMASSAVSAQNTMVNLVNETLN